MNLVVLLFAFFVCGDYLRVCSADRDVFKIGALLYEDNCVHEAILNSTVFKSKYDLREMQLQFDLALVLERVSATDTFTNCYKICNLLESNEGITSIFGPPSPTASSITQSVASAHEIPNIQYHWRPSSVGSTALTSLNVYPDADLLAVSLATIVRHMNWKSFVILYETDEGLVRLQEVLKIQTLKNINELGLVTIRQLEPEKDYRLLLKEIKILSETNIILDCETDNIMNVLQQAKDMELLENYYNYLITSLDAYTLDFAHLETAANITIVRLIDTDDSKQDDMRNVLTSFRHCPIESEHPERITTETALMYDALKLFIESFQYLHRTQHFSPQSFSCESPNAMDGGLLLNEFMKKKRSNLLTGPMAFNDAGNRVTFDLHVLEKDKSGDFSEIAIWTSEAPSELQFTLSESDKSKRILQSLQESTVRVSSRLGDPYLRLREPQQGEVLEGNDRYEGYSLDLIAAVAKLLNFTFAFEITAGNKYGKYDPETKQWDGLIRDLLDRKADLAICDLTITHERREVVDFSSPFMTLGISILYKKGQKEEGSMFAFMEPLSFDVWVYTSTLYLGVSIMLYLIARMAPGDWENPHPCDPNPEGLENIWDLKNSLWVTLGSIMTQGCDILPKGISSRTATSMWWFFSLIMTSSYTANMAAFLTKDRMGPTIDSAEALAKQTKIKYGTVNGGATQAFFRQSNFTTYKRMWNQMQSSKPTVFEKDNAAGVARVLTTKNNLYAFLMESSSLEYEVEKNCQLKQVGSWLDSKGYAIAMPVNSPYRSEINKAVLKLQEDGTLAKLKTRWWKTMAKKNPCPDPTDDDASDSGELALANVGGVFLVLGVGVALAFVLAIIEFLWNVHNVSVEEHITFWQALKVELKFVVNIWVTKKRVKPQLSEKSSENSFNGENKSMEKSILRGEVSLLNLSGLHRNVSEL